MTAHAEVANSEAARQPRDEIVVEGQRGDAGVLAGIVAEDELQGQDIAAYGLDTVGELVDQVMADVSGDGDGPVVLVNGRLSNGIDEVSDLPTEAVSKIQLLPKDAAARLAQPSGRRVINIVLKANHRQLTAVANLTVPHRVKGVSRSVAGDFTAIEGGSRSSLALRARSTDPLFEADRGVTDRQAGVPYDFAGNIISANGTAGEIDPFLSALSGSRVVVAGVPQGVIQPSLADFVRTAGTRNISDTGTYRTLIGEGRGLSANAVLSRRFGRRTTVSLTVRGELSDGRSLLGPQSAVLALPATSAYSPFSQAVTIARYFNVPLQQTREASSIAAGLTLNTGFGRYNLSFQSNFSHRYDNSLTDRQGASAALQAGIDNGSINPFANLPAELIAVQRRDLARTVADRADAFATLSGSPLRLPAGWISLSLRAGGMIDRQSGISAFTGSSAPRVLRRDEAQGHISLDLPLTSTSEHFLSGVGDVRAFANLGVRFPSDSRRLVNQSYGFNWQLIQRLSLRGAINHEQTAPSVQALSDPVSVIDNVRFYDFIRGETALVSVVTGGNPLLPLETRRTYNLNANLQVLDKGKLTFSADYTASRTRNAVSGLPTLSAIVQEVFAERFIRNDEGLLARVDTRPISFAREDREQIRWGVNVVAGAGKASGLRRLGEAAAPTALENEDDSASRAPLSASRGSSVWRLNFSLSHTWTLKAQKLPRAGMPVIDLLDGGAIGYGGGQSRHMVQSAAGIAGRGVGIQTSLSWLSASSIRAGSAPSSADLRFAPRLTINLRLFADIGIIAPDEAWAKGLRLTLASDNLLNFHQSVRDGAGATPVRYQPYLLDSLGRTVKIAIRKVF